MADIEAESSVPSWINNGRPAGAKNYGGKSFLAQQMRHLGFNWREELIDSYALYKKQIKAKMAAPTDPNVPEPNGELLHFWMVLLPYVTLKINETETRRQRMPAKKRKPQISKAAIEQLAKLEGRRI